jgi:hypothetical protein
MCPYLPLWTVHKPWPTETAVFYRNALECLSTQPEFPEKLRTYSHALYILGYEPVGDIRRTRGLTSLSRERSNHVHGRTGANFSSSMPIGAGDLDTARVNQIASAVVKHTFSPWEVPTEEQLTELRRLFCNSEPNDWRYFQDNLPYLNYYVSAASQAFRFLGSLSAHQRKALRHIVVHENRKSVAYPECHAQGLMPYLDTLGKLHIERKVDMWNTV